jgi:hypothetical protein
VKEVVLDTSNCPNCSASRRQLNASNDLNLVKGHLVLFRLCQSFFAVKKVAENQESGGVRRWRRALIKNPAFDASQNNACLALNSIVFLVAFGSLVGSVVTLLRVDRLLASLVVSLSKEFALLRCSTAALLFIIAIEELSIIGLLSVDTFFV